MDDGKLMHRLQKGDTGALEQVIRQYTPYAGAAACRVLGASMAREDLEEVVGDVFVSLWRHAETLDSAKGSLRAWIGTAAANGAKNKLRDHAFTVPLEENAPGADSPASEVERRDDAHRLWQMVEDMGEPDATLFFRYYYEGEKLKDIARELGMNVSTVKTRLRRGRELLKSRLGDEMGGGLT